MIHLYIELQFCPCCTVVRGLRWYLLHRIVASSVHLCSFSGVMVPGIVLSWCQSDCVETVDGLQSLIHFTYVLLSDVGELLLLSVCIYWTHLLRHSRCGYSNIYCTRNLVKELLGSS